MPARASDIIIILPGTRATARKRASTMVVGYNHNIRYRGEIFHVQTEDSGTGNPFITTLLYRGGTIIASKKTSYADILKIEMLEKVVEDLMQDQHKEMLRRLKAGEFDARAFPGQSTVAPTNQVTAKSPQPEPKEPGIKKNLDEVILDYLASQLDTQN